MISDLSLICKPSQREILLPVSWRLNSMKAMGYLSNGDNSSKCGGHHFQIISVPLFKHTIRVLYSNISAAIQYFVNNLKVELFLWIKSAGKTKPLVNY